MNFQLYDSDYNSYSDQSYSSDFSSEDDINKKIAQDKELSKLFQTQNWRKEIQEFPIERNAVDEVLFTKKILIHENPEFHENIRLKKSDIFGKKYKSADNNSRPSTPRI